MIPVFRPKLPVTSELVPYLERIDANRWYSNFGPLHEEFRSRIAAHFGLGLDQVALLSNATIALAIALQAVALKRPANTCICPSWTFAATPHAIVQAGMQPVFGDVDGKSWTLDEKQITDADYNAASAILVVSPFGGLIDLSKWEEVVEQYGVPVVCDAAASFDAIGRTPEFRVGPIPIIISLHATKTLPAGEGAVVLCSDPDLIERIRQASNFGFSTTSVAQVGGTNAKMNEYCCAVALAALDQWKETRHQLQSNRDFYHRSLTGIEGIDVFGAGQDYVANYMIVETSRDGYQLSNYLREMGIDSRRWWRSGCQSHPAFSSFNVKPLPQTRRLAMHTLGLPFYSDLSLDHIEAVAAKVGAFQNRH